MVTSLHFVLLLLTLLVAPCDCEAQANFQSGADASMRSPELATINLLLAGITTSLNVLLPSTIRTSGLDPLEPNFTRRFQGATISAGLCKEASLHGSSTLSRIMGLSSMKISKMEATSERHNFLRTRVEAPTEITAILEKDLLVEGLNEAVATCQVWPLGNVEVAKAEIETISNARHVSLSANITLQLNLLSLTLKSARVESVRVKIDDVETSCNINGDAGGLGALCPVISNQVSAYILGIIEGPLSAQLKDSLQAALDRNLPLGLGGVSSVNASIVAAEVSPSSVEPRRLPTQDLLRASEAYI